MKKNNPHTTDDEIDTTDLIRAFLREKILVLSISIICGLAGYLYASFKPQMFTTEIKIINPSIQIFEPYNDGKNISGQFIDNFKLNFLSLDNIQNFIEESREFDNFKRYLKSRNISLRQYFVIHKFSQAEVKENSIVNIFFFNHQKELDWSFFFDKYLEFIKKITVVELKNNLKLTILNDINNHQEALQIAKKIELEAPVIIPFIINEKTYPYAPKAPPALFYKGSKVLSENINNLNKKLIKLENDQFNYNIYQKSITYPINSISSFLYFALGLILGAFLSLVIIYFKNILK